MIVAMIMIVLTHCVFVTLHEKAVKVKSWSGAGEHIRTS